MAKVEAAPITKTMTVTFPESTTRNRNQTVTIPNLKSVIRVTVNTGNVSHTVNGEKVTVNVSNGVITRKVQTGGSYTPADSKHVTVDVGKVASGEKYSGGRWYSSDARYDTYDYNSNGYSGTLPVTWVLDATFPDDETTRNLKRWAGTASGTVTRPASDTRTYAYYYAYTVTMEYIDNSNPVLTITKPTPNSPLLALNNTVKEVV